MDARSEIIDHLERFFRNSSAQYGIEMAFLYGSWASGSPRQDSDIDVAILFSKEISIEEEIFERITDISLLLSSNLRSEVNIIPLSLDFGKPMLYYNAIASGLPLFFRDFSHYVDLKNEAVYQVEDFNIFGRDWQLAVARRNLETLTYV
ncbi:nucleotidyltransferase domain-containing protein [Candidatus Methylomirabilis sp.]|uniref:nucleotidyltransferase domain-containing protein n=1 Tax=Candidatus Methylomirabilis sp. TaxID=2032687 RepID=UPI0030762DBB